MTEAFFRARDQLLRLRTDLTGAQREFVWPQLDFFNWALDYFDVIAAGNNQLALRVVDDSSGEQALTFAELSQRSSQVANFLAASGIGRGDRILIMLGNVVPLWETVLAAMKLGAVIIPASTLLERDELQDRLARGAVKAVIAHSELAARFAGLAEALLKFAVGEPVPDWVGFELSRSAPVAYSPSARTQASDLLFLYFTSGTTAQPKLVAHSHGSYPVGHLSTMYWIGIKPDDVHLNLSSPGWAKHAWSCFFAPWNARATVLAYRFERFDAKALLKQLVRCKVTTFCAPPTVWRMLVQQDLSQFPVRIREAVSAGEPLNPEVIVHVRKAWGLTIRDGFGQTETAALIGNSPGQVVRAGSMGRPLPGCPIVLIDPEGKPSGEGEICIDLKVRPCGLMREYLGDAELTALVTRDGYYHTGDIATRDPDGYVTYLGRVDDLFKSSDYRISPFELESVLIEHPAVMEAAVVPSRDVLRLAVPKAFVVLAPGHEPNAATAASVLDHVRARLSPYKRVRRLEFSSLPKTISGKIRRIELRILEEGRPSDERRPGEFWEEDLLEKR